MVSRCSHGVAWRGVAWRGVEVFLVLVLVVIIVERGFREAFSHPGLAGGNEEKGAIGDTRFHPT